ncbi:NT-C2 domain-containing protein, partial [Cephalotus follicularis]
MFRLHKHKSDKFGDRFDFKFSNFQLLQVPKGWDKVFVSIISLETAKTITKSGKASVRNGNCQWTETLTDSIMISHDETSKETEFIIKFVVAMGSSKSGILGEATLNLASYRSSKSSIPVSLPLRRCNHGTILQVRIQCLTPRAKLRGQQRKDSDSYAEDVSTIDYEDVESKSDVSDGPFTKSFGSSSSNHLDDTSHPGELCSSCSFDSMEGSSEREKYSPQSNLNGIMNNLNGRLDLTGSQSSSPHGSYSVNDSPRSNLSAFNSKVSGSGNHILDHKEELDRVSRSITPSPLRHASSSTDVGEVANVTTKELRVEASMWEQNARKLVIDLEKLQKELFDQSKCRESLEMELSGSHTECGVLRQEIEQLKILLEKSMAKQAATENMMFQAKDMDNNQKELEEEIQLQKESNANLTLQLKKTQESNIELVSVLQELEDTIEKQKIEIDHLKMRTESEEVGVCYNSCKDSKQINPPKQVLAKKMIKASFNSDAEDILAENRVRQLRTEFEPEDNGNLEIQLQRLQELHKTLESTIQFLENSLEEKNHEIEMERDFKAQSLVDCEAQWRGKLTEKEEQIINLEAELSEALNTRDLKEKRYENNECHNIIQENEALKQKVQELERDCNELTDENLELLFKLKESSQDLTNIGPSASFNTLLHDCTDSKFLCKSESEVSNLKSQICELQEEMKKNKILTVEPSADHLLIQYAAMEMNKFLSNLHEQIQLFIANVKKQQYTLDSPLDNKSGCLTDKLETLKSMDFVFHKELAGAILNDFIQLKILAAGKPTVSDEQLEHSEKLSGGVTEADEVQSTLESYIMTEHVIGSSSEGVENLHMEFECEVRDPSKELLEKISEISKLKSDNMLKEEEVESQRQCQRDLETRISYLLKEKSLLERSTEISFREGTITSKCLDDLRNEITILNENMDSQLSANEVLMRKSSELENGKHELEVHLSELENENVQLSERICGLEAQLRYLIDERESNRLELQNSGSRAMNLQGDIRILETETEAQKLDMKQKLQDMQKRWLESQDECECLKAVNLKLQSTAESLIEEYCLLQKSNGELRKQKLILHERCTILESELRETQKVISDILKEIEVLEANYSSTVEEIASKEKAIKLELDALLHEIKNHNEKLVLEESLSTQMCLEKTAEVENLQRDVAHLLEHLSATNCETEKTDSESVLEVFQLRADKARLEDALQEVRGKLLSYESSLNNIQMETKTKIRELIGEATASKQNQEVLMADNEKLLELLEDVKSNKEKLKYNVRGLNLKLKASEYERLQLAEEICGLKDQLQKSSLLQFEVLALKKSISETIFEKERLRASFQLLSGDYEELKSENFNLLQKISSTQMAMSELEECRLRKVVLEEKVLRLEGDLSAREALGSHEAALKNELAQIRRANNQFQWKIKTLEEEKEKFLKRAQTPEQKLEQIELKQDIFESSNVCLSPSSLLFLLLQVDNGQHYGPGSSQVTGVDPWSKIQFLEDELSAALEANGMYRAQLK